MLSSPSSGRLIVYFSSVTQHFCSIERDTGTDEVIRRDITTDEHYSLNQFDSILPLLYYRQLLADGKMPDTIQGKNISAKEANQGSFFFRHKPRDKNSPSIPLYPLFESQSGRVDLKMPDDVFRLGDEMAFIDAGKNEVKTEKTERFGKVFAKENFVFPAKIVAGNPSPRKPYDEGYFVIDTDDNLYHFKMVKSGPFLKKVDVPNDCVPKYFFPYEPDDRSFYGFLVDGKGFIHVINTDNYKLQKLDCHNVDLDKQIFTIMGNPLYWTVRMISQEKEDVFAFDANTKEIVAEHHFAEETKGDGWKTCVFPFELSWTDSLSRFVIPKVKYGNYAVLGTNVLLALVFFFLVERKRRWKEKTIATLWIILTGVFGFIACLVLREKSG